MSTYTCIRCNGLGYTVDKHTQVPCEWCATHTFYTLKDHPLHEAIHNLCLQIERCGCSEELTKAVTMASALQQPVVLLRQEIDRLNKKVERLSSTKA